MSFLLNIADLNIADLIGRKTLLITTLCKYLGTSIHSSSPHEKSMVQKSIAISSVELLYHPTGNFSIYLKDYIV